MAKIIDIFTKEILADLPDETERENKVDDSEEIDYGIVRGLEFTWNMLRF